jgi:quinoprotein dehydrogenase-associated probable ABC transporter substrate-binding protein
MAANQRVLRVCADPNNLPFSNEQGQGFENKIAELISSALNEKLEYTWWSERKSFIKNSLDEGRCDAVLGIPSSLDSVAATQPYYRSTYVFVTRRDRNLHVTSLNDPELARLRIGIHVVGDDYAPPAIALARRGITQNITAFSLFGSYGEPNPPRKLIDAVAQGMIDVAIVWGPFAGYFAKNEQAQLEIAPVSPPMYLGIPFTYSISAGVRKGEDALKAELDEALVHESAAIQQILSQFGVPLVH